MSPRVTTTELRAAAPEAQACQSPCPATRERRASPPAHSEAPAPELERSPCSQQLEQRPRAATKTRSNQKKSTHLSEIEDFSLLRKKFLQSVLRRGTLLPQEGVLVHGLREHYTEGHIQLCCQCNLQLKETVRSRNLEVKTRSASLSPSATAAPRTFSLGRRSAASF